MGIGATDFQHGEITGAKPFRRLVDHRGQQELFGSAFYQDRGVGKEQVAMGEPKIALQERECVRRRNYDAFEYVRFGLEGSQASDVGRISNTITRCFPGNMAALEVAYPL